MENSESRPKFGKFSWNVIKKIQKVIQKIIQITWKEFGKTLDNLESHLKKSERIQKIRKKL